MKYEEMNISEYELMKDRDIQAYMKLHEYLINKDMSISEYELMKDRDIQAYMKLYEYLINKDDYFLSIKLAKLIENYDGTIGEITWEEK